MKINRAAAIHPLFLLATAMAVTSCSAPTVVPPSAPPRSTTQTAPRPAPLPPATAFSPGTDWRDMPQTPGDWRYESGIARFGAGGNTLFAMACNRTAGTVTLLRTGSAASPVPMSVITTSIARAMTAQPVPSGQPQLQAALPANDALLDAMAFSRGRFAIDVNGLPSLYLPAWPEVGRVIEDCRK